VTCFPFTRFNQFTLKYLNPFLFRIQKRRDRIGGVQISEGLRLVGFEFEARRGTIGGIQISEVLRLVGFTIPLFVPRI
jgi:hypothetical protein